MLVLGVFVIPLHAAIPAVATLSIPPDRRGDRSAALVIGAGGTFLVSALVLGREAVRRCPNPRTPSDRSEKA